MPASNHPESPLALRTTVISSLADFVAVAAQARLLRLPYPELRHVSCEFHEGVLTLQGRVSRRSLKQLAQVSVSQLEYVAQINNQLDVVPPSNHQQAGQQ